MGRMNYANRKTDGVKLGQSIARDLIKRIPPGGGSKAAFRDPVIELDVSGKCLTDEGFQELATALVESIQYKDVHGRVARLEELCLRDNQLHSRSLRALSEVVRMAAKDLRDLDLSNNRFTIVNGSETDAWEEFLQSFAQCSVLRRLNLSGNALGSKAFEVLVRVYGQEAPIDLPMPNPSRTCLNPVATSFTGTMENTNGLRKKPRKTSIASDTGEYVSRGNSAFDPETDSQEVIQHDEHSHLGYQTDLFNLCATAKGLRSIPYLVFSDTSMTDISALHLSYIITCHCLPEQLLFYTLPTKAGQSSQQLLSCDRASECQGIVYLLNPDIGGAGSKVLELAEAVRSHTNGSDWQGEYRQSNVQPRKSSKNGSPATQRRDTFASAKSEQGDRSVLEGLYIELERARSRIQVNILRELGPQSNDLWRMALKLLSLCRVFAPCKTEISKGSPIQTALKRLTSQPEDRDFPCLPKKTQKPFIGYLDLSAPPPAVMRPNATTTPRPKHTQKATKVSPNAPMHPQPTPANLEASPVQRMLDRAYRTELQCGFPEEVWCRILSLAVGVDGILSEKQKRSVLRWAFDQSTLIKELEILGKAESAQLWRVLEGMECLAYEVEA